MADFSPALAYILPNEGGYSNRAADRGGPTNFGITQNTLSSWNVDHAGYPSDVKDLTVAQAGDIYEANYWPGLEQITSQAVASKMLDIFVNFGPSGGTIIAQQAANTLVDPPTAVDGRLGPDTVASINAADETAMLQALVDAVTAHYHADVAAHPTDAANLAGWLARAQRIPALTLGTAGLVLLLLVGAGIWLMRQSRGGA